MSRVPHSRHRYITSGSGYTIIACGSGCTAAATLLPRERPHPQRRRPGPRQLPREQLVHHLRRGQRRLSRTHLRLPSNSAILYTCSRMTSFAAWWQCCVSLFPQPTTEAPPHHCKGVDVACCGRLLPKQDLGRQPAMQWGRAAAGLRQAVLAESQPRLRAPPDTPQLLQPLHTRVIARPAVQPTRSGCCKRRRPVLLRPEPAQSRSG